VTAQEAAVDDDRPGRLLRPLRHCRVGDGKELSVAAPAVRILPSHDVGGLASDLAADARALARKDRDLPLIHVFLSDLFPDWTFAFCAFDLERESCWFRLHWVLPVRFLPGSAPRHLMVETGGEGREIHRLVGPAAAARITGTSVRSCEREAGVSLGAAFPSPEQEP
jgi:hypothetical protein